MSNITLRSSENLKKALFSLPMGMPVSAGHLKALGISRQLAHYYVQSGWMTHMGSGYYLRSGDVIAETGAVAALQGNGVQVHIGGKGALSLKGFSHYINAGCDVVTLFGRGGKPLPKWFKGHFEARLTNSTLFDEGCSLENRLSVSHLNNDPNAPFVSETERAVLELLDMVPKHQSLEEAKLIIEGLQSLRSKKMLALLKSCKKIKVKRLFWAIAQELRLPVLEKLNAAEIDFGSKANYMLPGTKTVVLKNPNE